MRFHVAPSYFLDVMETYELNALFNYQHYSYMDLWDAARFQSYVTAQCNSTKKLELTDIAKFSWDSNQEEQESTEQQIEKIKQLQQQFANTQHQHQ